MNPAVVPVLIRRQQESARGKGGLWFCEQQDKAKEWKRLTQRLPACEAVGKKDLKGEVVINKPVVVDVAQFSTQLEIVGEREKI